MLPCSSFNHSEFVRDIFVSVFGPKSFHKYTKSQSKTADTLNKTILLPIHHRANSWNNKGVGNLS